MAMVCITLSLLSGCGAGEFKSSEQEKNYYKKYKTKRTPVSNPGGARFSEEKDMYKAYIRSQNTKSKKDSQQKRLPHNADQSQFKKITTGTEGKEENSHYDFDISQMEGARFIDSTDGSGTSSTSSSWSTDEIMQQNVSIRQSKNKTVQTPPLNTQNPSPIKKPNFSIKDMDESLSSGGKGTKQLTTASEKNNNTTSTKSSSKTATNTEKTTDKNVAKVLEQLNTNQ